MIRFFQIFLISFFTGLFPADKATTEVVQPVYVTSNTINTVIVSNNAVSYCLVESGVD